MESIPPELKGLAEKALGTAYMGEIPLPGNFLKRKLAQRKARTLRKRIFHSTENASFELNDNEARLVVDAATSLIEGRRQHGVEGDEEEIALKALIEQIKEV